LNEANNTTILQNISLRISPKTNQYLTWNPAIRFRVELSIFKYEEVGK
jgi:hypothetical protein